MIDDFRIFDSPLLRHEIDELYQFGMQDSTFSNTKLICRFTCLDGRTVSPKPDPIVLNGFANESQLYASLKRAQKNTIGGVVGAVLGGLLLVGVAALVIYCAWFHQRKEKKAETELEGTPPIFESM